MSERDTVEIAVVGAGAAGLAAALTFAREGFRTALIGTPEPRRDGRTVALLDGSVRFLEALGVWAGLRAEAAPLAVMRLIDDSGSLFRPPPASFEAAEIGLEAFGWSVESATLVERLAEATGSEDRLILRSSPADALELGERPALRLADGSHLSADLVVAADGRGSRLRTQAGLRARTWSYPQAALTVILAHDREHGDISTEFHTRDGPFTLVPLPGRRSSLVWVTKPDEAARPRGARRRGAGARGRGPGALAARPDAGRRPARGRSLERAVGRALRRARPRPRRGGGARLSADRRAGAQSRPAGRRRAPGRRRRRPPVRASPIGGEACLRRYQRGRDLDVRLRTTAVDGLNRTLLTDFLPVDLLRGAGLLASPTSGRCGAR